MKLYYLTLLIIFSTTLPGVAVEDSTRVPTLEKDEYLSAITNDPDFPENVQLLFSESYWETGTYILNRSIQLYGNGSVLMREKETKGTAINMSFYAISDISVLENIAADLVDLGLFESVRGACLSDACGVIQHSYYLSLRIGDEYYSIAAAVIGDEDPPWPSITEYMQTALSSFMVEDNLVTGTEYMEKREGIIQKYGYLEFCDDDSVVRYLNEQGANNTSS